MFNPEYRQPFIPLSWNYKEIARLNEVIFDQTGKQLYVRLGKDKYEPLIKANKPFTPAGSTDPGSGGTETEGDMGLVPAPKKGDENKVLIGNGTWISIEELAKIIGSFKGSSASSTGNSGFVPIPPAGSQNKVLKGDGTWGDMGGSSISSTAPSNKNSLWVDSNGNLKYFNTSTNSWKLVQAEAVWA